MKQFYYIYSLIIALINKEPLQTSKGGKKLSYPLKRWKDNLPKKPSKYEKYFTVLLMKEMRSEQKYTHLIF